ncbi:fasciclin-like arabinogalactan protein 3 [Cajanus cajan]|uniref:Fasciclin-like arabinogalactan protein 3 n=1 Tax=Cajanus cajan TaxID=3821 RepID=A0A151TZB2_CAJCA|nr:fasciclin-like arabinogalactan protein 3 [Cajanus cajan]KYP72409.1 Fasciclin-like arabinogalactan protein 3 [Cajanus cajan]
MGFRSSSLLCMAILLACSSAIYAFDITKTLSKYPKFESLNKYLTETKLAEQMNSRNTITLLAVDNGGFSAIANKSPETIKAIISTHVILDYYDPKKLVEAIGNKEQLTTLYQSSGKAVNNQGFLTVSMVGEGEIAFGSAVKGAPADDAEFVEPITSEPYNISIIHVTKFIIPPGIDSQAKAPAPSGQTAKAPVSTKAAKAPAPTQAAKDSAPTPSAKAPIPSETAATPTAESPVDAADASATSPSAEGPGPAADDGAADAASASSPSTTKMGVVGVVMAFASLFIVL